MRPLTLLMLVLALLVAVNGVAMGQEPQSGIGIQLLEGPEELAENPRAHLYIIDEVEPGATFSRRIRVTNSTAERTRLDLYAVRASAADGWSVDPSRGQNALSSWMRVEPQEMTLGAGEAGTATVTITVPVDATPGEHYAAVLAASPPRDTGGAISVVSRVGIRVYLFVLGEELPSEDFEITTLEAARDDQGVPFVLIGVSNTGERAIDVTGELTLTEGPGSLSAGPFPVTVPRTIGPGGTGDVRVMLDPELPAGPWLARANLRSGLIERAAEATIVFPDAAGESSEPVQATEVPLHRNRGFLIPLALGLIILTILLLALFWWWRSRQGGKEDRRTGTKTKQGEKLVNRK